MRPFQYAGAKDRELFCDRVSLARLVRDYGTPLYVYSANNILDRVRMFAGAFAGMRATLCYSVKDKPNLSILQMLADTGAGFASCRAGNWSACDIGPGVMRMLGLARQPDPDPAAPATTLSSQRQAMLAAQPANPLEIHFASLAPQHRTQVPAAIARVHAPNSFRRVTSSSSFLRLT